MQEVISIFRLPSHIYVDGIYISNYITHRVYKYVLVNQKAHQKGHLKTSSSSSLAIN